MGNFMEAGTKIGDLIDKINKCISNIANEIARTVKDRGASENDIYNLIKDLPAEYQVKVLMKTIVDISGNNTSTSMPKKAKADYFSSRGF